MASKHGTINNKNSNQSLPFFGSPSRNLYYGVELELAVKEAYHSKCTCDNSNGYHDTTCTRIEDYWKRYAENIIGNDWVVAGRDGTIGFGIELRTAPSSIRFHVDKWKPFFEKEVIKHFKATPQCGIHIHASKEFLGPANHKETTARIIKLADMIFDEANYSWLTKLFGRGESIYNKYAIKHKGCMSRYAQDAQEICAYTNQRRYQCWCGSCHNFNFASYRAKATSKNKKGLDLEHKYYAMHEGKYTIEFRVFPSTVKYDDMIANIETVRALMNFAYNDNNGTLEEFIDFLGQKSNKIPYLTKRIDKVFGNKTNAASNSG